MYPSAADRATVACLCGTDKDYAVHAFSWATNDPTNPSLRDARLRLSGALMGGISQEQALQESRPDPVVAEVRAGLDQTGGLRWLIAPGCSIPPNTPPAQLRAVRDEVESIRLTPERTA